MKKTGLRGPRVPSASFGSTSASFSGDIVQWDVCQYSSFHNVSMYLPSSCICLPQISKQHLMGTFKYNRGGKCDHTHN